MKIIEIIVDKLPKSCSRCVLLKCDKIYIHEFCPVINKNINIFGNEEGIRHPKCPLEISAEKKLMFSPKTKTDKK